MMHSKRFALLLFTITFFPAISSAQFWHALPPLSADESASAGFSNDEKKIFYISKEGGVANIYSITFADKYNRIIANASTPPVQVTKFTDRGVVRAFHLLNLPEVLYMRAMENGKDYHIYRMKDDGSNPPQDLTPAPAGVTAEMIGASYNGRFVYYTQNKVNLDKVDTWRYDAQQYINDLVFPNDKDYRVLAWSRDHGRLLVEDPGKGDLMLFDIVSTERTPLVKPTNGKYLHAIMDPSNHELIVLDKVGDQAVERETTIGSNAWKEVAKGDITWVDYSPNGKYVIIDEAKKRVVREIATGATIELPDGARPLAIAPKETWLLYAVKQADASSKLFLFDIAKKASTELAMMH